MNLIITVYVLAIFFLLVAFVVVTILFLRKDKYFALAMVFSEIAMFVAVSTFGQSSLTNAVLDLGGIQASLDLNSAGKPPFTSAVILIGVCGSIAIALMFLRFLESRQLDVPLEDRKPTSSNIVGMHDRS